MQTLEQQLADLIRKHGLTHISINVSDFGGDISFYAYAQSANGYDRYCGSAGRRRDLIAEAISAAISNLNEKRNPTTVEPLAPLGEAA